MIEEKIWGLKRRLAEAEKERDSLKGQLQKTQQQLKESTQVSIKLALQKGGQVDEMRKLKTSLRAASELAEKWLKIDSTEFTSTAGYMAGFHMAGERLQAALGIKASISETRERVS